MDALVCDPVKASYHRKGCIQLSGEHLYRLGVHSQLTHRRQFDVPGVFARDIAKMVTFVFEWYGKASPIAHAQVEDSRPNISDRMTDLTQNLPTAICFPPDFLPLDETPQKGLVQHLVKDLETFFKVEACTKTIKALWEENPPREVNGIDLYTYLKDVNLTVRSRTIKA